MYGSSKPNKEPYLLTKIYSSIWSEKDEKISLNWKKLKKEIQKQL